MIPFLTTPAALELAAQYTEANDTYNRELQAHWPAQPLHTLGDTERETVTAALSVARAADQRRADLARTLLTDHLIPALLERNATFAATLRELLGDDPAAALRRGEWHSGDQGGWYALQVTAGRVLLTATDSEPNYPQLHEFAVDLQLLDQGGQPLSSPYGAGYSAGQLHFSQGAEERTFLELLRRQTQRHGT